MEGVKRAWKFAKTETENASNWGELKELFCVKSVKADFLTPSPLPQKRHLKPAVRMCELQKG